MKEIKCAGLEVSAAIYLVGATLTDSTYVTVMCGLAALACLISIVYISERSE